MTKVIDVTNFLHEIAPPGYQESYDNSGLLIGDPDQEVSGVLVSLDCVEAVIEEAIRKSCNMVVCHHPIIFSGLKRLNGTNYIERTVMKAIKHDIAIHAIHTNLDNMRHKGVNTKIADKLDLTNCQILLPKQGANHDEVGAGMIGELKESLSGKDFLSYVKTKMQCNTIRHTAALSRGVRRVAVCGGAGSFLLREAKAQGADAFVTSDFKYHEFFDADGMTMIIDIGHYESERFTIELLFDLISNKFRNFAAHCTEINTNPIQYY